MIESFAASEDSQNLKVFWESGKISTLPAALLRREARDAWSVRERLDHGEITVQPNLKITDLVQIGAEGLNVHFSDGHDRAIYPFSYLHKLSKDFDN